MEGLWRWERGDEGGSEEVIEGAHRSIVGGRSDSQQNWMTVRSEYFNNGFLLVQLTTHEVVQFYVGKRLGHIALSESRPMGNESGLKQYHSNINILTLLQYCYY